MTVTLRPIVYAVRRALLGSASPGLPRVHHDLVVLVNYWASLINAGEKIER